MADRPPPLPGYEGIPLSALRERADSLSPELLRELIAYEEEHAARSEVLEALTDTLTHHDPDA